MQNKILHKIPCQENVSVKRKRGRPRQQNVYREPNGRISRAKTQANELALRIRAQKFNLTIEQAKNPRSESWVGRLSFYKTASGISEEQYEAAIAYLKLYNDYRKAILSPAAHFDKRSTGSYISEQEKEQRYTNWVQQIKKKYQQANKAIQEAQANNPNDNLYAAVQYIILENKEIPHLLGALRITLNALSHYFFAVDKYKHNTNCSITLGGNKYSFIDPNLNRDKSQQPLFSIKHY